MWKAGQGRTLVSAEGRDLIGSSAWKTPLSSARIDEVVGIHAVGDSCIAVLDRMLFGPVAESGKLWRSLRIPEYADTIWTHPGTNPESPVFLQTEGPGFYFMLPTKDGGAVAGGRLWRRNGEDTLSVIAIKLPPGEIGTLPVRQPGLRTKARENKGAIPFDASGRFRRKTRSPIFRYRP